MSYLSSVGCCCSNDQFWGYYHVRLKCRKYYKCIFWCYSDVVITYMFLLCCDYIIFPYKITKEFQVDITKALIGIYNLKGIYLWGYIPAWCCTILLTPLKTLCAWPKCLIIFITKLIVLTCSQDSRYGHDLSSSFLLS